MHRIIHIAVSFVVVVTMYGIYALVAVPWIEPSVERMHEAQVSRDRLEDIRNAPDRRVEMLRPLFRPDAWELQDPKILESDQVKLLLQDYKNLGDGRVEIPRCTVILLPEEGTETLEERVRQAVVLEASDGAMLKFDEPLDLRRAKIGRLVGGRLNGEIRIRSAGKTAGPEDDLLIVTRDVELTDDEISTPNVVTFSLGPNHGRGSQMRIKLHKRRGSSASRQGPNFDRMRFFELAHVEQLHMEFKGGRAAGQTVLPHQGKNPLPLVASDSRDVTRNPGLVAQGTGSAEAGEQSGDEDSAIDVICQGPFRFDEDKSTATFKDRVDVLRSHPRGPSDQLNCELLTIGFRARKRGPAKEKADKAVNPGLTNLEPSRIEARGNPVVLRAPKERVQAFGQLLEYDLDSKRILLEGEEEVLLQQDVNEIHARKVQYEYTDPKRLGRVIAEGPGLVRAQASDRPGDWLTMRWVQLLQVRPDPAASANGLQVLSLSGGADLEYAAVGRLQAGEIYFWFAETAGVKGGYDLRPDKMCAKQAVRMDSPQLGAGMDELQVWFESAAGGESPGGDSSVGEASTWRGGALTALGGAGAVPRGQPALPQGQVGSTGPPGSGAAVDRAAPKQHFELAARLLQVRTTLVGRRAEPTELTAEGGVRFQETQTALPGEPPVIVQGERLHVISANQPHATVTVTGAPALFEGRGLTLSGSNINLNRGTNELCVDGPGRMTLPMDRDLEGRALPNPGTLAIDWQRQMRFDGRTALFEESVMASSGGYHVNTETLEATLKEAIVFSVPDLQSRPDLLKIHCRGGVVAEGSSYSPQGAQISSDRIEVTDLDIHLQSGAMTAGPGVVTSVRRGDANMLAARRSAAAPPAPPDASQPLTYLNIRCRGAVTGNLKNREVSFNEGVVAIRGLIGSWQSTLDTEDPDALGDDGAVVNCERLSVMEMAVPSAGNTAFELSAAGNARVEGRTFTARGARISYSGAKDLLILEGDGRTNAELFWQQTLGGPMSTTSARSIRYCPSRKRLDVDGAQSLEFTPLQNNSREGSRPGVK